MNIRYLQAESLMCLLLPKKAVLLPWRAQPNVLFAYTFKEWQTFIADRRGGLLKSYREIRNMSIEDQKRYFYADACLSQLYEIVFSGESATNIIATETALNEAGIGELIRGVNFDKAETIVKILTPYNHLSSGFVLPNTLSSLCLIYCFMKSVEGGVNIWTNR